MQLVLPHLTPPDAARRTLSVGGRTYQVHIARHRRARRYLLRVSPDGSLRLTVPRGAAIADGLRFAANQAAWIEHERVRQRRRAAPWRDGSLVLLRGVEVRIRVVDDVVVVGDEIVPLTRAKAGGRARTERGRRAPASERVGEGAGADPPELIDDIRAAVEAHFMAIAARELPARLFDLAALHGLRVSRAAVRNQKSRWGSCSPRGAITINWRLIQMPPSVAEYVLLHELMHLRQANHSRRFWREVERVCPTWRDSERWLRKHGREIL